MPGTFACTSLVERPALEKTYNWSTAAGAIYGSRQLWVGGKATSPDDPYELNMLVEVSANTYTFAFASASQSSLQMTTSPNPKDGRVSARHVPGLTTTLRYAFPGRTYDLYAGHMHYDTSFPVTSGGFNTGAFGATGATGAVIQDVAVINEDAANATPTRVAAVGISGTGAPLQLVVLDKDNTAGQSVQVASSVAPGDYRVTAATDGTTDRMIVADTADASATPFVFSAAAATGSTPTAPVAPVIARGPAPERLVPTSQGAMLLVPTGTPDVFIFAAITAATCVGNTASIRLFRVNAATSPPELHDVTPVSVPNMSCIDARLSRWQALSPVSGSPYVFLFLAGSASTGSMLFKVDPADTSGSAANPLLAPAITAPAGIGRNYANTPASVIVATTTTQAGSTKSERVKIFEVQ